MTSVPASIDVHQHAVSREVLAAIATWEGRDGMTPAYALVANELSDPTLRLPDMDAAGVGVGVLSGPPVSTLVKQDDEYALLTARVNDDLVGFARAARGRFVASISIPFGYPDAALLELDRWRNEPLVVGVTAFSITRPLTLDDASLLPIWREIAQAGLPVLVHPALESPPDEFTDWNLASAVAAPVWNSLAVMRLIASGTLDAVPELRIVVAHLGGVIPYLSQRIEDQLDYEGSIVGTLKSRVWLDTCSYHPPAFTAAAATVGADRMVLGSDYPFRGAVGRAVDDVHRNAGAALDAVLFETASTLYGRGMYVQPGR